MSVLDCEFLPGWGGVVALVFQLAWMFGVLQDNETTSPPGQKITILHPETFNGHILQCVHTPVLLQLQLAGVLYLWQAPNDNLLKFTFSTVVILPARTKILNLF